MTQQKRLQSLFEQFCDTLGYKTSAEWNAKTKKYSNKFLRLDFNNAYGGYRLDWVNENSSESHFYFSSRFSNKEMAAYLQGLMQGYELKKSNS